MIETTSTAGAWPEDDCNCDSRCPWASDCGCISIHKSGLCICTCGPITLPPEDLRREKHPPTTTISLCAKNRNLASLAALLNDFCDAELLIPAARARENVTLHLKSVRIAEAIEHLGLLTR